MQTGCLMRPYKWPRKEDESQRKKGKIYPSELRVPENSKDRKPSQVNNAKKQRKTVELERLEISSRKLEHFMQKGHNKEEKEQGPNRNSRDKEEVARIHRKTMPKKS